MPSGMTGGSSTCGAARTRICNRRYEKLASDWHVCRVERCDSARTTRRTPGANSLARAELQRGRNERHPVEQIAVRIHLRRPDVDTEHRRLLPAHTRTLARRVLILI